MEHVEIHKKLLTKKISSVKTTSFSDSSQGSPGWRNTPGLELNHRPGPQGHVRHAAKLLAAGAASGLDRHTPDDRGDEPGQTSRIRQPTPWLPPGLKLTGTEGAGEVQTPLVGPGADGLRVGDRVWFRHAKAGELCEHLDALHLVSSSSVTEVVPTYRGDGRAFL